MSDKSKIEWCEATWSPIAGCSKISDGCKFCYAERFAYRLACMGQKKYQKVISTDGGIWNNKIFCDEKSLDQPLHWRKPRRIFVCSMSDLFHPKVPLEFQIKVMDVPGKCPQHTFLVLTKRPENAKLFFGGTSGYGLSCESMPNVHLGASISTQSEADEKIPILLQIPAAVRWLSIEPMLGAIDIEKYLLPTNLVDGHCWKPRPLWVVVGGESGPGARYCPIKNIRGVVEQCQAASVPVFVKQIHLNGKAKAIKDINQFPEDLRIQQLYPKGDIE